MPGHGVGSRGERTAIEGSDSDNLYVWQKVKLGNLLNNKPPFSENVMVCQDTELPNEQNCVVFVLDHTNC